MLPYYPEPVLHCGPIRWPGSTLLLSLGMASGYWLARWRATTQNLVPNQAAHLYLFALACGIPVAYLVDFSHGLSLAGVCGATAGAASWLLFHKTLRPDAWRWFDLLAFVFPFTWIPVRLGCTLAHDHPGIPSKGWLAVAYPTGPRLDLGLLELLFALSLASAFVLLSRKPWTPGLYTGLLGISSGSFRLAIIPLYEHQIAPAFNAVIASFQLVTGVIVVASLLKRRSQADETTVWGPQEPSHLPASVPSQATFRRS